MAAAATTAAASSGSSGSNSAKVSGTVNGAGSTFAAPVYQQFGSQLKDQGITLNYQPVGSGAGIAALAQGTAQFAGSDPALTPEDKATLTKGDPVQIPVFFGAITVSYNVSGAEVRPQARRPDARRHLPGQDHDLERPGDRQAQPRPEAPDRQHHGRPPLRRVGHHRRASRRSSRTTARPGRARSAPTRPSSGRPAPAPRATTASPPRSSRPTARSATSSRPTRSPNDFTSASVKNKSGELHRADARVDLGGRRGPRRSRPTSASPRSTRRARPPTRSPRRPSSTPTRTRARRSG